MPDRTGPRADRCRTCGLRAIHRNRRSFRQKILAFTVASFGHGFSEETAECLTQLTEVDPILRTFRTRNARLHGCQVEINIHTVIDLTLLGHAEHLLGLEVVFESLACSLGAARHFKIVDRLTVYREKTHGRTILRRHVSDRRSIKKRQRPRPFPIKFDKLPYDPPRA